MSSLVPSHLYRSNNQRVIDAWNGVSPTSSSSFQLNYEVHTRQLADKVWQPRQFEYGRSASLPYLAIGTCAGELVVLDWETDTIVNQCTVHLHLHSHPHPRPRPRPRPHSHSPIIAGNMSKDASILSLSWLHNDPSMLLAGASNGRTMLYQVNRDIRETHDIHCVRCPPLIYHLSHHLHLHPDAPFNSVRRAYP